MQNPKPTPAAIDEARKFVAMIPVRLTKAGGWLLEWLLSVIGRSDRGRSVFVVAVPRSGSTLLYNLLAWNQGAGRSVVGYGENCANYNSQRDTRRLRLRTMLYLRRRRLPLYVADKLVQSRYRLSDEILADADCYFILIEREPQAVLAGMQRRLGLSRGAAEALHRRRSAELAAVRAKARNQLSVSYEQLVADPDRVLLEISDFLQLPDVLTNRYEVPPNVNNFSYGDDGNKIRSGRIVFPPE